MDSKLKETLGKVVYALKTFFNGNDGYVPKSAIGANNGVASLNGSGKVPDTQLPSYVDDIVEGYYYNDVFYEEDTHITPIIGESGKIYVDLSTDASYRYTGTQGHAYTKVSSPIDLDNTPIQNSPNAVTSGGLYSKFAEYTPTSGLAPVATAGNYESLTGKPMSKTENQYVALIEENNPTISSGIIYLEDLNLKKKGDKIFDTIKIDDKEFSYHTSQGDNNYIRYIYKNVEDVSEEVDLYSVFYEDYTELHLNEVAETVSHLELGVHKDVYETLNDNYLSANIVRQSDIKQADWEEESNMSNAYIKNKTHSKTKHLNTASTIVNPVVDSETGAVDITSEIDASQIITQIKVNDIIYKSNGGSGGTWGSETYYGYTTETGSNYYFMKIRKQGGTRKLIPMANNISFDNATIVLYETVYTYQKLDDNYINDTIVRTSPYAIDNGSTVDLYPNHAKKALNADRINITLEGELTDRNNIWRAVITGNPAIIINCIGQTIKWNIDFATMTSGELYLMEITGNSTCGLFGTLININQENVALVPVGNPVSKNFTFDLTETTNCYYVKKFIGLGDVIDGHTVTTDTHFAINYIAITNSGTHNANYNGSASYISLVASDIDKYNNIDIDGAKNSQADWESLFAPPGATNPHFNQYGSDNKGKEYAIYKNTTTPDSSMPYAKLRNELPVNSSAGYIPSGDWDAQIGEVFGSVETVCNYFWLRCRDYGQVDNKTENDVINVTINFTLYEPINS